MYEKVNPCHPDKVADRIAGAIVDLAYTKNESARIAVEVLIGHGLCTVIAESSVEITTVEVMNIVNRIAGSVDEIRLVCVPQDEHLAHNQWGSVKCGDNGIFKGMPITAEQKALSKIAGEIYAEYPYDGKYILDNGILIVCQSHAKRIDLIGKYGAAKANPIGDWLGGTCVDTGATNRKLGSDMGDAVTGGGLHGKDLSKADVSVNIWCHYMAQLTGSKVEARCAIGDRTVKVCIGENVSYVEFSDMVALAKRYIDNLGGFEKLAEWGLI